MHAFMHATDALERMYMSPKTATARATQHILEVCHDLDLLRCYGPDKMVPKLERLAGELSEHLATQLSQHAERLIRATGDRVIHSVTDGLHPVPYNPELFPACSLDATRCWEALSAVAWAPVAAPPSLATSLYKQLYNTIKESNQELEYLTTGLLLAVHNLVEAYCQVRPGGWVLCRRLTCYQSFHARVHPVC